MDAFGGDEACQAVLEELRWPGGPECPRCQSKKLSRMYARGQFDCDSCGYKFSVTSGTVLHDTHLPLRKWIVATFLLCKAKKGMSALQLKCTIGVSYKTAWYLCHRIRSAIGSGEAEPLTGVVEADETWMGGKAKNMQASQREKLGTGAGFVGNKVQVLGAVQRGEDGKPSQIRLAVTGPKGKRADLPRLHSFIAATIDDGAKAVYTDENEGYLGVGDDDTIHATVNHGEGRWVEGDVHTNSAESACSLFKRGVVGSYHRLQSKHLDAYLGEFEWRFNNRRNPYLFRDTLTRMVQADTLTFAELTAKPA
jgi:transposase-like protein